MKTVFFTKEPEVCKAIISKLTCTNKDCVVSNDEAIFFRTRNKVYDLFVLDYKGYSHELFSIYDFMDESGLKTPVIFYNDPFPETGKRAKFWEFQLIRQIKEGAVKNIEEYRKFFLELQQAIESKELFPYISVIQEPLPFTKGTENPLKRNAAIDITEMKKITNMQNSVFEIFSILYEHRNKHVKPLFLQKELSREGKNYTLSSIYSYVSRLRQYLAQQKKYRIDILNSKKGYKLIMY